LSEETRNSSSSEKSYEHHTTCIELCEQVKDLLLKVQDASKIFVRWHRKTNGARGQVEVQLLQGERDPEAGLKHLCAIEVSSQGRYLINTKHILKAEKGLNVIRNMKGKNLME
jgi:hypothetical protein